MSKVWMPLYISDYLRDTMHLTAEQHGAYLLLCMFYWSNGPLPKDEALLAGVAKLSRHKWKKFAPFFEKFFTETETHYCHKRIDVELAKAAELRQKKKDAASKRWSNSSAPDDAPALHVECPSPSPSPLPSEDIGRAKRASPKTRIPQGFPGAAEIAWAVDEEHVPRETAEREAVKFRRDAEAKAKTFAMWDRAWKNWITGGLEKGWIGQRPKQSQSEKDDAAFREAARRIEANQ